MKKIVFLLLTVCGIVGKSKAQGLHFSQFYNAPLLINPSNTALMSYDDYRLGINYRSQWTKLPVPYNTFSAFGDCVLYKNMAGTSWLGMGLVFFSDKAGDGSLSMTRADVSLAYHVQMGDNFLLSGGLSGAYAGRSVNYNALTFDMQWDRFKFDKNLANGEQINIVRTSFYDVGAGLSFSYFPHEAAFVKFGVSIAHLTQPVESFYNQINKLGMRPMVSLDGTFIMNKTFTLNPAIYYTTQRGAQEIVAGTLLSATVYDKGKSKTSMIVGGHYRFNDAMIMSLGIQFGDVRILSSYDYTSSKLGPEMKANGAFEMSIVLQGGYGEHFSTAKNMNCPRFY